MAIAEKPIAPRTGTNASGTRLTVLPPARPPSLRRPVPSERST
jgi:hypothetical protein